jgi:hypothetical protein
MTRGIRCRICQVRPRLRAVCRDQPSRVDRPLARSCSRTGRHVIEHYAAQVSEGSGLGECRCGITPAGMWPCSSALVRGEPSHPAADFQELAAHDDIIACRLATGLST